MNIPEMAEKYPETWKLFVTAPEYLNRVRVKQNKTKKELDPMINSLVVCTLLALDFFPKHGIEIERYLAGNSLYYGVKGPALRDRKYGSHKGIPTPEAAIHKAFEILEEILKKDN